MRKVFVASVLAVSIVASSGCAEMGISKEQAGTAIGTIAGVAIGATMGKGSGQVAAMVIGGAAGAFIGNRIGNMLDERDQAALAQRTQDALNASAATASAASTTSWKSEHSGATAQITQGKEYTQTQQVEVKRAPKILPVPSMTLLNQAYVTQKSSNVRAAPNTTAEKVGGLQPGTEFTAIGSTGEWILVGRKGVTVGYVNKALVSPKASAKSVTPSVNLDDMDVAASPETKSFDLDAMPKVATTQVAAETACRPVTVSLKAADGKTEQEQNTFCRQQNGTWELI